MSILTVIISLGIQIAIIFILIRIQKQRKAKAKKYSFEHQLIIDVYHMGYRHETENVNYNHMVNCIKTAYKFGRIDGFMSDELPNNRKPDEDILNEVLSHV